ncbi:MAG: hypothetical protein H6760_04230 [Candidatus Nomurabacteria bacterium]|nr:MAG: hypothetical protein H6760_04230 [Candidatus Nomurabacteria bacterium]
MKLHYTPHQRDYTVLATSVVIEAFLNKASRDFFSHQIRPIHVYVENGVLWHFMADEDLQGAAQGWVKTHGTLAKLKQQKKQHDALLRSYNIFVQQEHADPKAAILQLHEYFHDALPFLVACIEVPEFVSDQVTPAVLKLFLQGRAQGADFYRVGIDLQKRLLRQIEKSEKLAIEVLEYLLLSEFTEYLNSGKLPSIKRLRNRRKRFVLKQGKNVYAYSNSASALKRFGLSLPKATKGLLKGNVAFPGKVKGKVRLIQKIADATKLRQGEILVTSMTDPRYIPAMKRAGAIVTDEGGVTSHASIVARELKVPCVIGTKFATSSLQSGDLVEVDANQGIVRRLGA